MTKCKEKCNNIKNKIDEVSDFLDDVFILGWLTNLENITDNITTTIKDYAKSNKFYGRQK